MNKMETMSSTIEPVVPRTANLLACKQWWRVCFLYGDQQKYYRQVYGKAAAQRLALSNPATKATDITKNDNATTTTTPTNNNNAISSSEDRDYDIITDFIETQLGEWQDFQHKNSKKQNTTTNSNNNNDNNETSHVTNAQKEQTVALFPAKYLNTSSHTASMTNRKGKKLLSSLRSKQCKNNTNKSNKHKEKQKSKNATGTTSNANETNATRSITVLDDPFLFGIDEDHLGDLIRPKQYAISATEEISKYFNYCVDQQPCAPQQKCIDEQRDSEEPKPALPPKKKPRPIAAAPPPLCLNDSELQFLNMSLRNRNNANDDTHDISFTFNEEQSLDLPENARNLLDQLQQETQQLSLQDITHDQNNEKEE